jgi:hypothetical protein
VAGVLLKQGKERALRFCLLIPEEVNAMALTLEEKKAVVAEVSEVAKGALSAVAAQYIGLTVEDLTNLRVKAR